MATYPDFEYGRDELAAAYLECGRFEDVLATDPTGVPAVAALLALGRGEEATALARRLEGGSIRDRARVRAALGDAEGALEVLEEAYRQGAPWILTLSLPDFDALRSDPRFTSLLESVGLPR